MSELEFPFTFQDPSQDHREAKLKVFGEQSLELHDTQVMPGRVFMPKSYAEKAQRIYNLDVRPDDIWIVTYPKCGTTWTKETMWQIVNYDLTTTDHHFRRTPFLELEFLNKTGRMARGESEAGDRGPPPQISASVDFMDALPSPRVVMTHIPLDMLPPNLLDVCKVVYVCRNPKDACVSYFHHYQTSPNIYKIHGTFEDHAELFMAGRPLFGDYWSHMKKAWKLRNHPNLKFLWYEDMKRDHTQVLRDLCTFTGHTRSEEQISALVQHLTIDSMRQKAVDAAQSDSDKEFATKFHRKGQVGDWHNYLSGPLLERFDQWIAQSLEGTDIAIPSH